MVQPQHPTSRLVNLQYELAMLVGQELQLERMLRRFFPPALKALGCRAAHVWLRHDTESTPTHCFSYPARDAALWRANADFQAAVAQLDAPDDQPRSINLDDRTWLLLMPLEQAGFCVLVREGSAIDPITIAAIRPIFKRLANACRASIRHEQVEKLQILAADRELRLRTVLQTIGEVIFQTDSSGRLSFLTPAWESMTGISINHALGHPLADFLAASDRPRFSQSLHQTQQGATAGRLELRLQTVGGELKDVIIRLRATRGAEPFRAAHRYPGRRWYDKAGDGDRQLTGTIIDVTEIRRAERLKREFTATVSHELRTPLTSIVGAIGLLDGGAGGELPARARELIAIAGKNSARLRRLIDDILDMEKLLAGKMNLAASPVEPGPLIEQTVREHFPLARQRQIDLDYRPGVATGPVQADPHRFSQVLSNLLSNAIKFSPPAERVEITCRRQAELVHVAVLDRGPGIAPAFEASLIEPFTQGDASDSRQEGGTGLGLAISRALIEQMGGRIGVKSRVGQGANFWFELPAAQSSAPR